MSTFNETQFKEGLVSELSLYDLPSTQTSVKEFRDEEVRPISQVSSDGPFEFRINAQNSLDYLDLKNSQIYVKLRVEKLDGSKLSAEKVGPANLFLQSLFSTVEVTLQNKVIVTCNYNPYRAYIPTLLKYGEDALSSQINTQGWCIDDADAPGVTDPSKANNGLFERAKWIATSNSVDLQGPIFHDFCDMDRYLLNQVDVKIKLYRNPATFSLLAADAATDFRIEIEDIYIIARKVKVNPAVLYGHSQILEKQNALYPYTKKEVRVQTIATGSSSFIWDNMFQGKRPEKVIIGFVKSKALNGDYTTNPFNFEHCNITQIVVYNDGLPVGGTPVKTDFSKEGSTVTRAYTNLLQSTGKWRQNEGFALNRNHFISGSTLFVFQSEPNFSHHGEYLSLVKSGNSQLAVQFGKVLTGKQKFLNMLHILLYFFII